MAKDKKKDTAAQFDPETVEQTMEQEAQAQQAASETETPGQDELAREKENYLRLAAEYDNFRKRSQREREALYLDVKAETVAKFLPVYDNLERAMKTESADEAYKKGVEMTMTGLLDVLEKLGVEVYGQVGDGFDPTYHNAVMHCEDEALGENVLAEVFQKGFRAGEKVIRFAMVRVAN